MFESVCGALSLCVSICVVMYVLLGMQVSVNWTYLFIAMEFYPRRWYSVRCRLDGLWTGDLSIIQPYLPTELVSEGMVGRDMGVLVHMIEASASVYTISQSSVQ